MDRAWETLWGKGASTIPKATPWFLGPLVSLGVSTAAIMWGCDYWSPTGDVPDGALLTHLGWAAALLAAGVSTAIPSAVQLLAVYRTGSLPWSASVAVAITSLVSSVVFLSLAGALAMSATEMGTGHRVARPVLALGMAVLTAIRLWFTATIDLVPDVEGVDD